MEVVPVDDRDSRAPEFKHAITGPDLVAFQRLVQARAGIGGEVLQATRLALTRMSRPSPNGESPEFVKKWIAYGASVPCSAVSGARGQGAGTHAWAGTTSPSKTSGPSHSQCSGTAC